METPMSEQPRRPYPPGEEPRDPDRSTGPDQAGIAAGPTAGHAANNDDAALGLGGTPAGEPGMEGPRGDESPHRPEGGSGLELGSASLGSSGNSARRVDEFNVPTQD
jgi:hypothetical protein